MNNDPFTNVNEHSTVKEVDAAVDKAIDQSISNTIGEYDYALTTVDNPFDPLDDFDNWFMRDSDLGYYTTSYLARMIETTPLMTDEQVDEATLRAMKLIVYNDPLNIYTIIKKKKEQRQ